MLYQLFSEATTEEEFNRLLDITFTESERAKIVERWRIFEAYSKGYSQREVAKSVPCSIVTATRGAKAFRDNKEIIARYLPAFLKKDNKKG